MQALMKALAWTFVHSLWQGLVMALLAGIIISVTRKTTARLRYNLLGILLVMFLASSFITFLIELKQQKEILSPGISLLDGGTTNTSAVISPGFVTDMIDWFNNNSGLLLLLWVFFFLINCVKLFTGLAAVHRLRNYKVCPVSDEWKVKFEQLRKTLGIHESVRLLQSELIKVPVALGFLKPVILLPIGLITHIPPEQVESILLHELGHIRRNDYLVNFVQHFAEAIYFFNPGLLWVSSLLRQEREACCDDIVISNSREKKNYLNALLAFQEYSLQQTPYVMAISSKKYYLLNRIKRMITMENKRLNLLEKLALLSGLLIFSAFTFIQQEQKIIEKPVNVLNEQVLIVQQPPVAVMDNKLSRPPVKGKPRKIHVQRLLTDTVPKKTSKPLPEEKKTDDLTKAEKKLLQDIVNLKNQIGDKKKDIGKTKEELNDSKGKDQKKEHELKNKLEKQRAEIEIKRDELDKKREEHGKIKNEARGKEVEEKKEKEWENKKGNKEGRIEESRGNRTEKNRVSFDKPVQPKDIKFNRVAIEKVKSIPLDRKPIEFKMKSVQFDKQELKYKLDLQFKTSSYSPKIPDVPKKPTPLIAAPKKPIQ